MMRLWMIQPSALFEAWSQEGVYRPDPALVDPGFRRPYGWMMEQMKRRLPPAPEGCASPVWAWRQAQSAARPRPDLRTGGHLPRGTAAVLLTLAIEPDLVLLSDFDLWHAVLNDHPIPQTKDDPAERSDGAGEDESWTRIFDLDFAPPGVAEPRERKIIQATFWRLTLEMVKGVTTFTAR